MYCHEHFLQLRIFQGTSAFFPSQVEDSESDYEQGSCHDSCEVTPLTEWSCGARFLFILLSFAGAGVVIFFAVENYINLPSSSPSVPAQNTTIAPTITTSCGQITGSMSSLPFGLGPVFRYAGIPFGQPPVGDLRLRAPVAATCPWSVNNGIIDGSLLPPICVQADGSGSEDCLFLNVVTPTTATSVSQLPVIVYFHGGDLLFGSAVDEIRSIEGLVAQSSQLKQDVIAVTVSILAPSLSNSMIVAC